MTPRVETVTATIELPAAAVTVRAAPPELLSQHNVVAALGIPERTFLELVRAAGFPLPVIKLGRLRLVEREAFVSWLRSRPSAEAQASSEPEDGAAALLDDLGLERRHANGRRTR